MDIQPVNVPEGTASIPSSVWSGIYLDGGLDISGCYCEESYSRYTEWPAGAR